MVDDVTPILLTVFIGVSLTVSPAKIQFSFNSEPQNGFEYSVTFNTDNPFLGHASLKLSELSDSSATVSLRGVDFGLESQIEDPRCGDIKLELIEEGKWHLPENCNELEWMIRFTEGIPNSVDVSRQESIYFPDQGWWLLSEPTSLLRIDDMDSQESVLVITELDSLPQLGATQMGKNRWRIPPIGSAPEFYVIGNVYTENYQHGIIHSVYVIDDPERFSKLPLVELHASALEYFSDIFGLSEELPEQDRRLLVVWLSIDEAHGEAGGAAGSRSFLANYVDGDEENRELNAARTALILAHEQVHQMVDVMRPDGPAFPLWMSEGFAHYYGLKALMRSSLPDEIKTMIFDFFIDFGKNEETGLLELNRMYQSGDGSVYPLFYAKGAAFFYELDELLIETYPDSNGMDNWIPNLMNSRVSGQGLPDDFVEQIKKKNPEKVMALINHYLGE